MELFGDSGLIELLKNIFGEAASRQFMQTCSIFALAAFVHARQVRKEIRTQFEIIATVLRQDLDAQQKMFGLLSGRVDKLEEHIFKNRNN